MACKKNKVINCSWSTGEEKNVFFVHCACSTASIAAVTFNLFDFIFYLLHYKAATMLP